MPRRCQWCSAELTGGQRKWCSENCRKRACDDSHRAPCANCGEPLAARSAFNIADRVDELCVVCHRQREAAARRARIDDVAQMYRDGMSYRQINAELGYTLGSTPPEITEARRLGLIGYRYPASRVEAATRARWAA